MTYMFALITGASAGIGKALAEQFARRGLNLLLVALPGSGLPEVATALRLKYKILARTFEVDLTNQSAISKIESWITEGRYQVQVLVNNAFGNLNAPETSDPDFLLSMMQLNNHALVQLTRMCIPFLKKNRKSYILNVGSLASFLRSPNKTGDSDTKSFVDSFTSALRIELRPYGISVSCLCPVVTITNKAVMQRIGAISSIKSMFWQMTEDVAADAVGKLFQGKRRIVPGWHNKIIYWLWALLPGLVSNAILRRIFCPWALKRPLVMRPHSVARAYALVYR